MNTLTGAERIAQERATHEAKGYTAADDDRWENSELAKAAVCYAAPALTDFESLAWLWPWGTRPPTMVFSIERRLKQLAKAGALIAAEIDRLERYAAGGRASLTQHPLADDPMHQLAQGVGIAPPIEDLTLQGLVFAPTSLSQMMLARHEAGTCGWGCPHCARPEERTFCNYEDCDQEPVAGSCYCAGHLEQEREEAAIQEGLRSGETVAQARARFRGISTEPRQDASKPLLPAK